MSNATKVLVCFEDQTKKEASEITERYHFGHVNEFVRVAKDASINPLKTTYRLIRIKGLNNKTVVITNSSADVWNVLSRCSIKPSALMEVDACPISYYDIERQFAQLMMLQQTQEFLELTEIAEAFQHAVKEHSDVAVTKQFVDEANKVLDNDTQEIELTDYELHKEIVKLLKQICEINPSQDWAVILAEPDDRNVPLYNIIEAIDDNVFSDLTLSQVRLVLLAELIQEKAINGEL